MIAVLAIAALPASAAPPDVPATATALPTTSPPAVAAPDTPDVPNDALTISDDAPMPTSQSLPCPYQTWQGQFVTCLTRDHSGNIWIGTEDIGVWRYTPTAAPNKRWAHFNGDKTLGDTTCYCLTCDSVGRIWAGTLNHGVSVYNGVAWKHYGIQEGSVGLHVVDLAISRVTGDVWGATEAGLFRYVRATNTWRSYSREQGLPSAAITAVCFDKQDDLFIGTASDGVAVASPTDDYGSWHVSTGPDHMPNAPAGVGLPTGQINCLCSVPNRGSAGTPFGDIYAGTTTGLARTSDGGKTWTFVRGANWGARVKGLYHGPTPFVPTGPKRGTLVEEDYVTCLANAGDGHLLVGHRQAPVESIDLKKWQRVSVSTKYYPPKTVERQVKGVVTEAVRKAKDITLPNYATAILPLPDGSKLISFYGRNGVARESLIAKPKPEQLATWQNGGMDTAIAKAPRPATVIASPMAAVNIPNAANPAASNAARTASGTVIAIPLRAQDLPAYAAAPKLAELNALLKTVSAIKPDPDEFKPKVIAVEDDWKTEGDWLGRYGRYWACLCATQGGGGNYYWGAGWETVDARFQMGPNHNTTLQLAPKHIGDELRYWVEWTYTSNPRSLELPTPYVDNRVKAHSTTWKTPRRESEMDDHGEAYPQMMDGPHIYSTLHVPHGLFYLSLYTYNKDAHVRYNFSFR